MYPHRPPRQQPENQVTIEGFTYGGCFSADLSAGAGPLIFLRPKPLKLGAACHMEVQGCCVVVDGGIRRVAGKPIIPESSPLWRRSTTNVWASGLPGRHNFTKGSSRSTPGPQEPPIGRGLGLQLHGLPAGGPVAFHMRGAPGHGEGAGVYRTQSRGPPHLYSQYVEFKVGPYQGWTQGYTLATILLPPVEVVAVCCCRRQTQETGFGKSLPRRCAYGESVQSRRFFASASSNTCEFRGVPMVNRSVETFLCIGEQQHM